MDEKDVVVIIWLSVSSNILIVYSDGVLVQNNML